MTTTTAPTSTTASTPVHEGTRSSGTDLLRGAGIGIAIASVVNVVVFLLGNLGAPVQVVTGWAPDGTDLRLADVLVTTVVFVLLGAAALWLLERFRADGFRIWVVVAAVLAVGSILPVLRLDVDAGSLVALAAMHLTVGAAAIVGQSLARPSRG